MEMARHYAADKSHLDSKAHVGMRSAIASASAFADIHGARAVAANVSGSARFDARVTALVACQCGHVTTGARDHPAHIRPMSPFRVSLNTSSLLTDVLSVPPQDTSSHRSNTVNVELGQFVTVHSQQELQHLNSKLRTVSIFSDNKRLGVNLDCDSKAINSFHLSKLIIISDEMW